MARQHLITSLLLAGVLALALPVMAQTGNETFGVISWRTDSSVPFGYHGKALPNKASNITLALDVFVDGKPDNSLATKQIQWFVNNRLVPQSLGKTVLTISASQYRSSELFIRAVVDEEGGGTISVSAIVPVVEPRVVIDAPYSNNFIPVGGASLRALSYFFSMQELPDIIFTWKLQGRELKRSAGGDSIFFEVDDAPEAAELFMDVLAEPKNSEFIRVSDTITLMAR